MAQAAALSILIAFDVKLLCPVGNHEEIAFGRHLCLLAPIRLIITSVGALEVVFCRWHLLLQGDSLLLRAQSFRFIDRDCCMATRRDLRRAVLVFDLVKGELIDLSGAFMSSEQLLWTRSFVDSWSDGVTTYLIERSLDAFFSS